MSRSSSFTSIVPASIAYLAIYNPTLGTSDGHIADQLAYYYSEKHEVRNRTNQASTRKGDQDSAIDVNERFRQIGLAQGILQFSTYDNLAARIARLTCGTGILQMAPIFNQSIRRNPVSYYTSWKKIGGCWW